MTTKTLRQPIILTIIGIVLLVISWLPFFTPLIFVAFIPLFFIVQQFQKSEKARLYIFTTSFFMFFGWNIGTTWWLKNATLEGAIAAFFINSLLMCLPVLLYHFVQKKSTSKQAEWIFVLAWLSFEYLHHKWEFSWPWLTIGNVFSTVPSIVQWLEFTGVAGGSLWVLYTNILIFRLLKNWHSRPLTVKYATIFNIVFFLGFAPIFCSYYVKNQYRANGIPITVAVVQPNIDPYHDKFEGMEPAMQTAKMLALAQTVVDSGTQLVCFPETALLGNLDEGWISNSEAVFSVKKNLINLYPQLAVLSGADTYKMYSTIAERTYTARKFNENLYYDSYNTALLIDKSDTVQIYHKSKLVPGVEAIPYQQYLAFLITAAINLGGTSGSLGRSKEATNFNIGLNQKVAPVICYESIFGEYVTDYVRKGAGLLCIITNDGWWGNTAGHRNHFDYARLRAIETRRYVARSANTGISGFIDDKGNIISETIWWTATAQKATLLYLTNITFYVKYAKYIEMLPIFLLILALLRRRK